jgi:hypothetical protein
MRFALSHHIPLKWRQAEALIYTEMILEIFSSYFRAHNYLTFFLLRFRSLVCLPTSK